MDSRRERLRNAGRERRFHRALRREIRSVEDEMERGAIDAAPHISVLNANRRSGLTDQERALWLRDCQRRRCVVEIDIEANARDSAVAGAVCHHGRTVCAPSWKAVAALQVASPLPREQEDVRSRPSSEMLSVAGLIPVVKSEKATAI